MVTQLAAELGIARNSAVVAYDDNGGLNAARFWWVMSLYGKSHVRVLRKGWYGAASEGFPLSLAPDVGANSFAQSIAAEDPFVAEEQAGWRATLEDVVAASSQVRRARPLAAVSGVRPQPPPSDSRLQAAVASAT